LFHDKTPLKKNVCSSLCQKKHESERTLGDGKYNGRYPVKAGDSSSSECENYLKIKYCREMKGEIYLELNEMINTGSIARDVPEEKILSVEFG